MNPANRNPQNTDLKKKTEAEIKKAAEDKKNADAAAARKLKSAPPTSKVKAGVSACKAACAQSTGYNPPSGPGATFGPSQMDAAQKQLKYISSHQYQAKAYGQCTASC